MKSNISSLYRQMMVRCFSGVLPLYTINEFPKSGGTWVGQMLASALELPFPRNCTPNFEASIMHGHYLHPFGMRNVLCVWRDGRDVIVSWYFHCLFNNEHHNHRLVDLVRSDLDFTDLHDVRGNLPKFIEYSFTRQKHPNFSWSDFVNSWHSKGDYVHVRYEDLRLNPSEELQRIVFDLSGVEIDVSRAEEIVYNFSFSKVSGRSEGEENHGSFMRKGIVGDWKNHFSHEARVLFDRYAGEELIQMGYEKSREWVGDD